MLFIRTTENDRNLGHVMKITHKIVKSKYLTLFRLGVILVKYRLGAHCALCFSFICGPITTKLGRMVLWHKSLKSIKILMTSSLSRAYNVIKQFSLLLEVKIRDLLAFVQFGCNFAQGSILGH